MATTNLGKILIINRGSWDASASYQPLDVVSMNNSTALYLCKVANTGVDPSTDPTKWDLWVDVNNVDAYTKAETDEKLAEKADVDDIPTKTSELENDSGFLTEHQSLEEYAKKSELPTKTSDLTNDSGFITNEYHDSTKLDASLKGVANGVASLDAGGKVPTDQLPSFVDDVVEGYFYNEAFYSDIEHTQVITGEANKIYVDLHTNNSYRWSGSAYILISIANVYTKEETNLRLNEKVTKEIVSSDGKAIIFNESDGGGAKFENVDNTWSFVGVNNGGADGLAAQVYAVDSTDNYKGSKLDVTTSGIYYTTGDDSVSPASDRDVAANEIATMGDIPSLANYYTKTETDEKILWESGAGEGSVQVKGSNSSAESDYSVAEGLNTKTLVSEEETQGRGSHAEGVGSIANASASHAEGNTTMTLGSYSHAEGSGTTTGGVASHAEGNGTVTNNFAEHAEGSHNVSNKASDNFGDAENTISSIGIGTSLADKKNAWEVMQNGDAYLLGVGEYDGTNPEDATSLQNVINNIGGADWTAAEGEAGYIANKPFDAGSIDIVLEDLVLEWSEGAQQYSLTVENPEKYWFTDSDVGKIGSVSYNGETYTGVVSVAENSPSLLINMKPNGEPLGYPAFGLMSVSAAHFNLAVALTDDDPHLESITISEASIDNTTKLDPSKIKIDNKTLVVNDDGELERSKFFARLNNTIVEEEEQFELDVPVIDLINAYASGKEIHMEMYTGWEPIGLVFSSNPIYADIDSNTNKRIQFLGEILGDGSYTVFIADFRWSSSESPYGTSIIEVYSRHLQENLIQGDAIDITDDTIAVKYDNSTIKLNSDGELEAEIPTITASTVDLEDGVSPLATGALYLVYEE